MSRQRMLNTLESDVLPITQEPEVLTNEYLQRASNPCQNILISDVPALHISSQSAEPEKKVYTIGQWSIHELLILQAAKKEQQDNSILAGVREKHRNRSERWSEVEEICWRNGIKRSAKACQTKWDILISDYKKVHDYEKEIPSGQNSYWQMCHSDRKARQLPMNFHEEVYNAMDMWLCKRTSVNPSHTISDTSAPPSAQCPPTGGEENMEGSIDADGDSAPSGASNINGYSNGRKRLRTPRGSEGLISVILKSEEAKKEWWEKQEEMAREARRVSTEIAMEGRRMTYDIHRDNSIQRDRAIEVAATAANALVNIGSGLTYLAHTLNMSMSQGQFNGRSDQNGSTSSQHK